MFSGYLSYANQSGIGQGRLMGDYSSGAPPYVGRP